MLQQIKPGAFFGDTVFNARLSHTTVFIALTTPAIIFTAPLTRALGQRRHPPWRIWFRSRVRVRNPHTDPDI